MPASNKLPLVVKLDDTQINKANLYLVKKSFNGIADASRTSSLPEE
jgi:hypothetical protein